MPLEEPKENQVLPAVWSCFFCMLVSGVYIYCCKNIFYAGWGDHRRMIWYVWITRSKFTLKTVYFVNSKGIGRIEMNNYPSCQYQYTPQTLVLWDHIYNILRGKKQKQEYPFLASKYIKRKLTQTLLHGRVIVEVHGPSLLIRYTLLLFL